MNQRELDIKRKQAWDTLELIKERPAKNSVRFGIGLTKAHEQMKFDVCYELQKQRKWYVTEATFKTGGRADILVLDDWKIIEILHTETIEELNEKIKKYPDMFEIININTQVKFLPEMIQ